MSDQRATAARRRGNALVAAVYLVLALAVHAAVLGAPRTWLPISTSFVGSKLNALYQADERFVVAAIATRAHRLLYGSDGHDGFDFCYPMPASYTLGEHMFGETLLAAPFYLATGDPILAYNAMLVLSVWIAALAMYALALHWTGSMPAAFVAGMLFAFNAARLSNPAHPFVHGNLWTPLALLFAERLFAGARWRDAAGLALAIVLQLLESFYQVMALAILGATIGIDLLFVHLRELRALLPKLLAAVAVVGVATWLVFGPYLGARAVWGVLQGRGNSLLIMLPEYLPGRSATVGLVALVLAVVGLADRARGRRMVDGRDPRLSYLCAGLMVFWATLMPFALPLVGWVVPNPLVLFGSMVPGLDAVRVLSAMRFGVFLVVSFLAAYGVVCLTERLSLRARWASAALLAVLVLLEAYEPWQVLTPRPATLTAFKAALPPRILAVVRDLPPGAVLDLPALSTGSGKLIDTPHHLMLAAFHQRPTAACYNSFPSPLQNEVAALTDRLPEADAADALYAIGFRTVLVHGRGPNSPAMRKIAPLLRDPKRIQPGDSTDGLARFTLSSPRPVAATLDVLAVRDDGPPALPAAAVTAAKPWATIELRFANPGGATFRHPTFAPLPLTARWYDASGTLVASSRASGMLPLALASGEIATRPFSVAVPSGLAPQSYRVDLVADGEPAVVLARRDVQLG